MHNYKLKVNLIQNSALSFSVCIEDKFNNFEAFISEIKLKYKVSYVENVSLYTIRHANQKAIDEMLNNYPINAYSYIAHYRDYLQPKNDIYKKEAEFLRHT